MWYNHYLLEENRGVAQVVAHLTGGQGAAGSSPVTPTISSVHNVYEVMNTRFFSFIGNCVSYKVKMLI